MLSGQSQGGGQTGCGANTGLQGGVEGRACLCPVATFHPVLEPLLTQVRDLGHLLPLEVLQLGDPGLVLLSLGEIQLGGWVVCSQRGGHTPMSRGCPQETWAGGGRGPHTGPEDRAGGPHTGARPHGGQAGLLRASREGTGSQRWRGVRASPSGPSGEQKQTSTAHQPQNQAHGKLLH